MASRKRHDRRGRPTRGSAGLLEREAALGAIIAVLDATRNGSGRALLIEGHAGMGKTRLHEAALDEARARGLRVLRAAGGELEQNVAFGVAGRLVRRLLNDLPTAEGDALLALTPSGVRSLVGARGGQDDAPATDLAASHGLFAVLATAGESRPALVVVDDLHWCDAPSLEFVLYVLNRLDELPVAVVMTRRPGAAAYPELLDRVATDDHVEIERLHPLGIEGVGGLVARELGGEPDTTLVETCLDVTSGNPFYLHELLLALRDERSLSGEELAARARALAPDAVTRSLRVRVGRLGPPAAALARAVAILGDDAPLRHAARLAELTIDQASSASDSLAAVEVLLAREPLRFVHPLVRRAIEQDIPPSERATRHLDSARLLEGEGADAEHVAAHVLRGRAEGDPWNVEVLRRAAREAADHGGWQSAARYLRRALEEPPPPELRVQTLVELGLAEEALGDPVAADHLARAAAGSPDPLRRAELALHRGRALGMAGRHEQAAAAYDEGLRELAPESIGHAGSELRDQLNTAFVVTAALVPSLQRLAMERAAALLPEASDRPITQGQRLLLAQAAVRAVASGEPAPAVVAVAERAWDGGKLLEHSDGQLIGWPTVASVFCLTGALERSLELTDAAIDDARRRAWPLAFATASFVRGLPQLWQGRVDAALADLELARDARRYGWREFSRSAAAHYALCLLEAGELDRAERVLDEDGTPDASVDLEEGQRAFSLAELRLAQGRHREAFELASSVSAAQRTIPFFNYWRTTAAQAALAIGRREHGLELAREALARSERTEVPHLRIRSLRVLGSCEGGEVGLANLRAAVELGRSTPPRLETIRALAELGAALRRSNRRTEARAPLTRAADLAKRGGARALFEQARSELAATGARPRRELLLSGPAALTPSERRIAQLAAGGHTNREIAHRLFVTPKTVEYHLRNAYRKLDIETRGELEGALAE